MKIFNPGDSPVVINTAGQILGGGEHADVDETPEIKKAVAEGDLLATESKNDPGNGSGVEIPTNRNTKKKG